MIVKTKLLQDYLHKKGITREDLIEDFEVCSNEVDKLINGARVCKKTTRAFIEFVGVDEAQDMIDWQALACVNPLACEADEIYSVDCKE